MTREDLTSGIKPPKFRVGRFILNEYEAREMIARIAEGTLDPEGIVLTDEDGKRFTFNESGTAQQGGGITGWRLATSFTIRKLRALTPKLKTNGK